jgi:sterol desaturase/sphingolipid hydroxylase (fatty acid hydroxylase superfamily)
MSRLETELYPPSLEALLVSVPIGFCIAAGLVVAVDEWKWLRRSGRLTRHARGEMMLSLSLLPPNLVVSVLAGGVWASIFLTAEAAAPWRLETGALATLFAFVACDFSYYWEHRCAHRVGLLWRLYHAHHHSSPHYTVATAYRVCFLNQALAPAFYLPWVLLGLPPLLVFGFQLACFHYQAWLHTESIGPLRGVDRWLNTPANHRIHHSTAARHTDRNMGAVLMVWDRLFGTYARPEANLSYGIAGAKAPRRWWEIYVQPWRSSPRFLRQEPNDGPLSRQ